MQFYFIEDLKIFYYKYYRYDTLTNSVTLPLMYFRFNSVTVFACISVTIIVSVHGVDVFPLTGISVTVNVNGKHTDSFTNLQFNQVFVVVDCSTSVEVT